MSEPSDAQLSPFERLLTLFTRMRAGEGRSVALFFSHGFLLLFSYMIVKALREALMLTKFSAEVRAYAVAVIALLLMVVVPLYSAVRRRLDGARLLRAVTVFFALCMLVFVLIAYSGVNIAFAFFVWVSIYGVMVIAQFWAFAADSFNLKSGQRLFPVIMLGANLGALVGAKCAQIAAATLSPLGLMLVANAALLTTLAVATPARNSIPDGSRALPVETQQRAPRLLGGIGLVFRDRYLLQIAMLVVVLNLINSNGEFMLADLVQSSAYAQAAQSPGLDAGQLITSFYGSFQTWVTLVGLLTQLFLVARIYRWVGLRGALLVHPTVVAIGYGLIAISPLLAGFVPVFTLIRLVKIAENSVDYSLMNTTRHVLFLPVDRDAKYDGKTAIDTFFWRFGDLLQAGVVYLGVNVFQWSVTGFAGFNLVVALGWLVLAWMIGREFGIKAKENVINVAPQAGDTIPDLHIAMGQPFRHALAVEAFTDADPGDVLRLHARCLDGQPLPRWIEFRARERLFTGVAPGVVFREITVVVIASDVDGLEAQSTFVIRARPA
jgi:AAA family ATP:ADP antiporter